MSERVYFASVSGGKDSAAMCLWLKEQGIPFRAVNFDTGWEHSETYRYLQEVLPEFIGPIESHSREPQLDEEREGMAAELEEMLGHRSAFVRWCLHKGAFPSRRMRFCTENLKVLVCRDVMRQAHAEGLSPISVVGIRAAESLARSKMKEKELAPKLECMVWRPLIRWSEQDVIDIHKRHGLPPNPLYLRGAMRVGCWPCIQARKSDLRMLEEPRIRLIERLEEMVGELARRRIEARGEEMENPPHFFLATRVMGTPDGKFPCVPIRKMVAWGKPVRGGRVLDRQLGFPGLNDGCLRWGMCETGTN